MKEKNDLRKVTIDITSIRLEVDHYNSLGAAKPLLECSFEKNGVKEKSQKKPTKEKGKLEWHWNKDKKWYNTATFSAVVADPKCVKIFCNIQNDGLRKNT